MNSKQRAPYRVFVSSVRSPLVNGLMCKPVKRVQGFMESRRRFLLEAERLGAPGMLHDLYVQVPVCLSKCSFCPGPTRKLDDVRELLPRYLDALHRELDMYLEFPAVRNSNYGVVYIGGGTPSVLSAEDLYRLVRRLLTDFSCKGAVVTVEGNATSFTREKLAAVREAGANRISVGVQSFREDLCELLRTPHKPAMIPLWMEIVREIGFDHINLDLIAGIPGDTLESLERDIDTAVSLGPTGLSVEDLMLVPHTALARAVRRGEAPRLTDSAGFIERLALVRRKMEALGWVNIHGNVYSRVQATVPLPAGPSSGRGACVAVGTSAYGVLGNYHHVNCDSMTKYIELIRRGEFPIVRARVADTVRARAQHAFVDFCYHFRIDRAEFKARVGADIMELAGKKLQKLERQDLVELDEGEVRLTTMGKLWSGRVCLSLLGPRHLMRLLMLKVRSESFGRAPESLQHWMLRRSGRW